MLTTDRENKDFATRLGVPLMPQPRGLNNRFFYLSTTVNYRKLNGALDLDRGRALSVTLSQGTSRAKTAHTRTYIDRGMHDDNRPMCKHDRLSPTIAQPLNMSSLLVEKSWFILI